MLTMVTVQNIRTGTLLLPLMDSSGGYAVEDIQGLDPVKATFVSSSQAQMDGAQLHNKRREPRNILMKLGLKPDYINNSVASLRSNLYRYLMPKSTIIFSLYSDEVLWGITEAEVESFENNMFTADPEVDISLICYDPDFHAPSPTLIESQTVTGITTQEIEYDGTSETGIKFTLTFPGTGGQIRLYNTRPDLIGNMLDINGVFQANDILTVDTNQGQKAVTITRSGLIIPALYYLASGSSWINLVQGNNLFRAYYSGTPIPFDLEYTEKYGGF
jgi:Phage tail protein